MAKEPTPVKQPQVDPVWVGVLVVMLMFWGLVGVIVYAQKRDEAERADKLKAEAAEAEHYATQKMIEFGGVEWIAACAAAKGKDGATMDDIKRDCIPEQMLRKEGQ